MVFVEKLLMRGSHASGEKVANLKRDALSAPLLFIAV